MTMVRNKEWKLVHFLGEDFGQLFDLSNDPGEIRNLWDEPDMAPRKQELLDAMQQWLLASHVRSKDWAEAYR